MNVDEMPVVEPGFPPFFRDADLLTDHMYRHFLLKEDEHPHWRNVLEPGIVDKAREEYIRTHRYGSACQVLEQAYQKYVGRAMLTACEHHVGHSHSACFKPLSREADSQVIECWWFTDRIWIAADAIVRNGALGAYYLRTGGMFWPHLSEEAFVLRGRERARDRDRRFGRKCLAVHDGESAVFSCITGQSGT